MPPIKPRQYQKEAMNALHKELMQYNIALLQAATGAGKTFIIVKMIEYYFNNNVFGSFLLLMHKQELILQFVESFEKFTAIDKDDIGVCCAGIRNRKETDKRITIASVQTLANQLGNYPGADFIVIDETHRAGHENGQTQYNNVLYTLKDYRPNAKILGVTATAYRLGHGMIYGDQCRKDRTNFFPRLTHRITYKQLKDEGYLMPLKGLVAAKPDLSTIDLSKGEYNITQAANVMVQHCSSAVDALEKFAEGHSKVAVFACTIEHAEKLLTAFKERGHNATIIHSKLTALERSANMSAWRDGDVRICINVNVLIEGFDFPELSCLITLRPTKSPVVYIQAIGRILRMYRTKKDSLLIDLGGWVEEFGSDLDNPVFNIPSGSGGGEEPLKICQGIDKDGYACALPVHPATRICPDCGYEWTVEEVEALLPKLKEVEFCEPEIPEWLTVTDMAVEKHVKHNGQQLMKILLWCDDDDEKYQDWICFPDHYQGHAVNFGRKKWEKYSDSPYPDSVDAALWLAEDFRQPRQILTKKNGKYVNVVDYLF